MNLVFVDTGLFTDPTGLCDGLRPLAEALFDPKTTDIVYHSWDESPPDTLCRNMLAEYTAKPYEKVFALGHSFGGALLKFFGDWLAYWHAKQLTIDLGIFFDPAPNGPQFNQWTMWQFAQLNDSSRWQLATTFKTALCFYQHNQAFIHRPDPKVQGHIFGVCGVPFCEASAKANGIDLRNVDASSWGVNHVSIITDDHVQGVIRDAVQQILPPAPPQAARNARKGRAKGQLVAGGNREAYSPYRVC